MQLCKIIETDDSWDTEFSQHYHEHCNTIDLHPLSRKCDNLIKEWPSTNQPRFNWRWR